jgi:3-hydroxyisobutyrate dehydrogenase-like beta-hydroxyacid dehydrogenase
MNLGFVGPGRMGGPMVRRLLAAGHSVTVIGRSASARADLAAAGATVATGVRALADAEIIGVCVFTDAQVRTVCLELLNVMAPGSALVVHTTCSPRTIEFIGSQAEPRGIAVIDAGISGAPEDIAAGHITLYVGGTAPDFERVRPFLQAYGDPVLHVGPRGAGQKVKLLNNAVFGANIGILAQVAGVAAELGLAEETVLGSIVHGSASSYVLEGMVTRTGGSAARYLALVGDFISKDLDVVRQVAADLGADLGALNCPHDLVARLLAPQGDEVPSTET